MLQRRETSSPIPEARAIATALAVLGVLGIELATAGPDAMTLGVVWDLVAHVALLGTTLGVYLHWRFAGGEPQARLALALVALTVVGLSWPAVNIADTGRAQGRGAALVATHAVLLLGLLVLLRVRRLPSVTAPVPVGIAAGLGLAATRAVLVEVLPRSSAIGVELAAGTILAVLALATGFVVSRLAGGVTWARVRLGVGVTMLALGVPAAMVGGSSFLAAAPGLVVDSLGFALLATLTYAFVRTTVQEQRRSVTALRTQLEEVEAGFRTDRKRMHEIRATAAGISSATQLLSTGALIPPGQRARMQHMVDAELARLVRLASEPTVEPPRVVDLESTITPIVQRQQAKGQLIRCAGITGSAIARPDDIAEIVSVLLENARQHAPGAETWLEAHPRGEFVEVIVSDLGPGVDANMRGRIFDWGVRSPTSHGEGIGLCAAQELAAGLGGDLHLVDEPAPGATFVLRLPGGDPTEVTAEETGASSARRTSR